MNDKVYHWKISIKNKVCINLNYKTIICIVIIEQHKIELNLSPIDVRD